MQKRNFDFEERILVQFDLSKARGKLHSVKAALIFRLKLQRRGQSAGAMETLEEQVCEEQEVLRGREDTKDLLIDLKQIQKQFQSVEEDVRRKQHKEALQSSRSQRIEVDDFLRDSQKLDKEIQGNSVGQGNLKQAFLCSSTKN